MRGIQALRQQTIETSDHAAAELAKYFRGMGPRKKYIDYAFEAAGSPDNARVIEIGCGDGRDAKAIVEIAGWYLGIDISSGMVALAKEYVPTASFEIADAATFNYPEGLNIVFAFASILHLNQKELSIVLKKVHRALRPGGIFYISSKYAPGYQQTIKKDKYGERLFYLYNAELVMNMAGGAFTVVDNWRETIGTTEWFEIALKKI